MTHAEKIIPVWYRTGMEICTALSFMVEGSSSLSLRPTTRKVNVSKMEKYFSKKGQFSGKTFGLTWLL